MERSQDPVSTLWGLWSVSPTGARWVWFAARSSTVRLAWCVIVACVWRAASIHLAALISCVLHLHLPHGGFSSNAGMGAQGELKTLLSAWGDSTECTLLSKERKRGCTRRHVSILFGHLIE